MYGNGDIGRSSDALPRLTLNPLPTVFTNGTEATHLLRQMSRGGSGFNLQRMLPSCESPRIRELARGLDHDWCKCYFFVRDNIDFTPVPGFMRGPERTLLDREGGDADQALLLHALLGECGIESDIMYAPPIQAGDNMATFAVPAVGYNGRFPYNAASWLGINEVLGGDFVANVFRIAGRNAKLFDVVDFNTGETNTWMGIDHF